MWTISEGQACYSESSDNILAQNDVLTIGDYYLVTIDVVTIAGTLTIESLQGKPTITQAGYHSFFRKATQTSLAIKATDATCIENVSVYAVPAYEIIDSENSVVGSGIAFAGYANYLTYKVDWSSLDEGCYKIRLGEYESDCLDIKANHECSILLTWTNEDNAFGFEYVNTGFTASLRVKAKKDQPKYGKEKEKFTDSRGNKYILYSKTFKEELLRIEDLPEYIHDALSIGVEHDEFRIDGVEYVNEEDDYSPGWRKSSDLAPVQLSVFKKVQGLVNNNCG